MYDTSCTLFKKIFCMNLHEYCMNLLMICARAFNGVMFFTVRNEVAKVMFLHLSVILFGGGVSLSA